MNDAPPPGADHTPNPGADATQPAYEDGRAHRPDDATEPVYEGGPGYETGEAEPGEWVPAPDEPPRDSRWWERRWLVPAAVAVVVLVAAAGLTAWWIAHPAPAAQAQPATQRNATSRPAAPRRSTPAVPAAYGTGTCLTERSAGGVQLDPVPCTGDQAVMVIDKVVAVPDDCATVADYPHHGFELDDRAARVAYCLSLVVPAQQCFVFSNDNSVPFQRAACGSAPDAVRVLAVESAPNAETACPDQTSPDVWFYSSPTSGQYACVSRPAS